MNELVDSFYIVYEGNRQERTYNGKKAEPEAGFSFYCYYEREMLRRMLTFESQT